MTKDDPSAAKILAKIITEGANYASACATVQRSHRFPLDHMVVIENMAKMPGVSVSAIINQILDAGMEAVRAELSSEVNQELSLVTQDQIDRPTKTVVTDLRKAKEAKFNKRSYKMVTNKNNFTDVKKPRIAAGL